MRYSPVEEAFQQRRVILVPLHDWMRAVDPENHRTLFDRLPNPLQDLLAFLAFPFIIAWASAKLILETLAIIVGGVLFIGAGFLLLAAIILVPLAIAVGLLVWLLLF